MHPKGGNILGLVSRIISLRKSGNTKLLDYVGLIINSLKNRRVGVSERDYTGILIWSI